MAREQNPRVAADNSESLPAWSLRLIEVIGRDIHDAWAVHETVGADRLHHEWDKSPRTSTGIGIPGR